MGTETKRPLAVVTGAASGIGFELARLCIANDFDVVICADDARRIQEAAARLGANVIPITADLATTEGVEKLAREVEGTGRHVDALLITTDGRVCGPFIETPLDEELRMIAINCTSVVHLAKRLVPAMAVRGRGRVLITAPVASAGPTPYLAVYGATKAFELSLAESLREELQDSGVTITALGRDRRDDPVNAAKAGFEAMMTGKDSAVIAASFTHKLDGIAGEIAKH